MTEAPENRYTTYTIELTTNSHYDLIVAKLKTYKETLCCSPLGTKKFIVWTSHHMPDAPQILQQLQYKGYVSDFASDDEPIGYI